MLHAQATEILPQLKDAPLVQHWSGLRPGSPDNIPTIDRHPQFENLYINSGHFRYGVTMAPASAEMLANLILGRPQALDISPYRWPTGSK
jgi:glycine oxidase